MAINANDIKKHAGIKQEQGEPVAWMYDWIRHDSEQPKQEQGDPVAIRCKAKRENNGVCPNHNLQCGWPKCNDPLTPVKFISSEQLSAMFQDLKGIDTSQSGYHWRVGYNAALRQAMDYSMPLHTTPQQRKPLTDEQIIGLLVELCVPTKYEGVTETFAAVVRAIEAAHGIKE